jgi:hypothetical protein
MRKTFNTFLIILLTTVLFAGIIGAETPGVAAETQNVETSIQLTVSPNPVGVGQRTRIDISIDPPPPNTDDYFTGILIIITIPDEDTVTIGPLGTIPDLPGKTNYSIKNFSYVPTKVGLHNLTVNYMGDTFEGGITYLPSTTETVTLNVTSEMQPQPTLTPAPTQTPTTTTTPTPTTTPLPTPTASPPPTPSPTPENKKTATLTIETENEASSTGSAVTIAGRLYAPETVGIAVQDILLSYSIPDDTSWITIDSCMTNEWGKYSFRWTTPPSGTFSLKAEWAGNSEYYAASNTTTQGVIPIDDQQAIVQSNSTITQITYNQTVGISFTVSGETGTEGYSKVVVPQSLMPESQNIHVYIDEKAVDFDLSADGDAWIISFSYQHSSHQVVVTNTNKSQPYQLSVDNSVWFIAGIVAVALAGAAGVIVWLAKKR